MELGVEPDARVLAVMVVEGGILQEGGAVEERIVTVEIEERMYEKVYLGRMQCRGPGGLVLVGFGLGGRREGCNFASQVALQKSPSEMGEKARGACRCSPAWAQPGRVTLGQWWRQTNQARKLASGSTSFCGSTFTTRWPSFGLEI